MDKAQITELIAFPCSMADVSCDGESIGVMVLRFGYSALGLINICQIV